MKKTITIPSVRIVAVPGQLRVWHIPQVRGEPFYVTVRDVGEAKRVLSILADYDLFQLEHNIKPDYANAQGLEVFEDGEWVEWWNDDGEDISDVVRRES